jgi:hypothetical protein
MLFGMVRPPGQVHDAAYRRPRHNSRRPELRDAGIEQVQDLAAALYNRANREPGYRARIAWLSAAVRIEYRRVERKRDFPFVAGFYAKDAGV